MCHVLHSHTFMMIQAQMLRYLLIELWNCIIHMNLRNKIAPLVTEHAIQRLGGGGGGDPIATTLRPWILHASLESRRQFVFDRKILLGD